MCNVLIKSHYRYPIPPINPSNMGTLLNLKKIAKEGSWNNFYFVGGFCSGEGPNFFLEEGGASISFICFNFVCKVN